jgi:hypothetical protein
MSWVSSGVLLMDGLLYVGVGAAMLSPYLVSPVEIITLYASTVKGWREYNTSPNPTDVAPVKAPHELAMDIGYRFLAYLLVGLGLIRALTAFHWGCGYIHLGLATSLGEIALLSHELLRYESLLLHQAMAFMLLNVVLSIVYIANALPYCV